MARAKALRGRRRRAKNRMVKTASTMLALGTPASDFRLSDPGGKLWSLADFQEARALLVMFLSNHCPFVQHVRQGIAALVREYQDRGLAAVGINSNDVERYPEDSPDRMAEEAVKAGYTFPYLFDESQSVAKAYRAACTPDFFLFDQKRKLVYRGQLDGARPGNGVPVTGADLRAAVDCVLAKRSVPAEQKASLGCNIKWKPGNEPSWFGS
jgi:peroxiredoxin